jgi:hypothetical protein
MIPWIQRARERRVWAQAWKMTEHERIVRMCNALRWRCQRDAANGGDSRARMHAINDLMLIETEMTSRQIEFRDAPANGIHVEAY